MSAQLQVMFSAYFNVLSDIVWTKPNAPGYDGWKQKMKKEALRQWYSHSERIIFLENAVEGNLFKSYFGGQLAAWRKSVNMSTIKLAELTGAYCLNAVRQRLSIQNRQSNPRQYRLRM